MKLAFQLAFRNLKGAGLRTLLNAGALSFAFVIIIFFNGLMDGWNEQAKRDSIAWQYGYGHVTHEDYDIFDPFTILDAHGVYEHSENLEPLLIRQATIYPDNRMVGVMVKGISQDQQILDIPTKYLKNDGPEIPMLIGKNMAESNKLNVGDQLMLRWRDAYGSFDAGMAEVVQIFETNVPSTDAGQIWIPIERLWEMTALDSHATYYIANEHYVHQDADKWVYQDQDALLEEISEMIEMKKYSAGIMYILLMAIALLAIFDTQVFSIFRRQREIGTYIALGMTRPQVVGLFTVEGSVYSIAGVALGALYGFPLFYILSRTGIPLPMDYSDFGIAIAQRIFPVFGLQLVLVTIILVVISATIVSFIPARKISKMDPVLALKGKLQ
ncbi:MAG: ABC transporter permease [Bacteroidia bacterium]